MKTQSDSQQHWYVLLDGKRHGPFSYAELTKAAREGVITAETNIWRSGWKNWHLAKSVKGLVPERTPAPPMQRPAPADRAVAERPVEAPLAPDDTGWADHEHVRAPEVEAYQYTQPQSRDARRSPDTRPQEYRPQEYPPQEFRPQEFRSQPQETHQDIHQEFRQGFRPQDLQPQDLRPQDLRPQDLRPQDLRPQDLRPQDLRPQDLRPQDLRPQDLRPHEARSYEGRPQEMRPQETRPQEDVSLRWDQQPSPPDDDDDTGHIFADEWRMLAEQPAERPVEERRASVPARIARPAKGPDLSGYDDDMDFRPAHGADGKSFAGQAIGLLKRVAIGLGAVVLLFGGAVVLFQSGVLQPKFGSGNRMDTPASPGELPSSVAALPAAVALQRNDPQAFDRFKKRYAETAANARSDEVMTLARNALRKSVKHLLAISSGEVLVEITDTSLGYLQGLQANNPESCVALSDESKGARLTSNLARDLPTLFRREMAVLEKIASTNPHIAVAPMSAQDARPYFDRVAATLLRQQVKTDLQSRDRLDPSEFAPYCSLVIAFYQAVLDLPQDDKVNLLRYLYATAAANADTDLKKQ